MLGVFSENVQDPRVTVSEGTFENTGIDSGWADIIVIANVSTIITFAFQSIFD